MNEDLEKCAWCRHQPRFHCVGFVHHHCPVTGQTQSSVSIWNNTQRRTLERRRQDFEAARGNTFESLSSGFRWDYPTFNDYVTIKTSPIVRLVDEIDQFIGEQEAMSKQPK